MLVELRLDPVEQAGDPAPGLGRHGQHRRPLAQAFCEPRPDVLDLHLGEVPLREDGDRRTLGLSRHVRDRQVLVDHALARIDEHERNVRALGGGERPQLRVVLDPLPLAALAAKARGVDEDELPVTAAEDCVYGVARRARLVGDDHALLAEQRIQQARLADVRSPEDRDADRRVRDCGPAATRQPGNDRVEQVAGAVAVSRRERKRIAESEPVELERERVLIGIVDLVSDQHHRLVRRAQDLGELLVAGCDAGSRVGQEEHEVGLGYGRLRLLGDRARNRVRAGDVDTTRVDQQEPLAVPLADKLLPVARDARRLVHDRRARLGQAVDERRLADVREADDRDGAEELVPGPSAVFARHAGWRSRTSCSMRETTSSTSSSVVSICTASAAGIIRSASLWSRMRRSVASASAPISGRSASRRSARVCRSAFK
jgi:hypothetical protein